MKNSLKISIPNPCSQNWDDMQSNNNGRFCSSCEKTVVDFTKMDDDEFIAYFQNIKNTPCGRFTKRQLSLDIPLRTKLFLPFWKMNKYVAASMIAAAGLGGKVFGQNVKISTVLSDSTKANPDIQIKRNNEFIELRGLVVDNHNEAIPGASIKIINSGTEINTDIDGRFQISVSKISIVNNCVYLKISSLGLMEKKQTINISSGITSIKISLEEDNMMVGDIVTVKPTRWQRLKWWLKNNLL